MKPSPHQFRTLTAYRLAEAEQARKQALWQNFWRYVRFFLLTILVSVGLIVAINFPAQVIAIVCLGGASLALCVGAFFWECRNEAKQYNDEFDL